MKKLLNYNKFNFIKDNLSEGLEFAGSMQGANYSMPGCAMPVDPSLSIYGFQDSPYTDFYSRRVGMINSLMSIIKNVYKSEYDNQKMDFFLEDIDEYKNIKILRMVENNINLIDIFISFEYYENEFFGVFKNFNKPFSKPEFKTELYQLNNPKINREYKFKLNNYLFKILNNWFIPKNGFYKNLKDGNILKNEYGEEIKIKKDLIVEVLENQKDNNDNYYLMIKIKDKNYRIIGNDYYWFNWRFEKTK